MFRAIHINACTQILQELVISKAVQQRSLSVTCACLRKRNEQIDEKEPERDSRKGIDYNVADAEISKQYLQSKAYRDTYGDDPVWKHYRRNFRGHIAPETRITCVRKNVISTGNACPVCRDQFLCVSYKNRDLLQQFLDPMTGEVLPSKVTGVCQKQHQRLQFEVAKAQDYGYLEKYFPLRKYNYSEYYRLAGLTKEMLDAETEEMSHS
ncbi:28S ribosomal protein S18b, mitochondrial-like [Pecten maximus]|uniref:28S ribosomal protein S18b, mitochondrial-like n=1 Tax=Pecten maximus TaxID=6579 RepID=UPI00145810B2|nr:28S ribosomal protein S18b, mitochondrial-like [Pecten maximus]